MTCYISFYEPRLETRIFISSSLIEGRGPCTANNIEWADSVGHAYNVRIMLMRKAPRKWNGQSRLYLVISESKPPKQVQCSAL
jgi:hypothetical protein